MDAETRSAVEHELRRLRREHEEELARNDIHFNVKPPKAELRKCFIHNAVPFVAFGFLDNFIMLIAGDAIESTFGWVLNDFAERIFEGHIFISLFLPPLGLAIRCQILSESLLVR